MIEVTEKQLWEDFIYYQSCTRYQKKRCRDNPYIRAMKPTVERLRLMGAMSSWCNERNLPVRQWLFTLFAVRRWLYSPRLDPSHLCSEKHIKKFETFSNYTLYTQYLMAQELSKSDKSVNIFDPNRDLNSAIEDVKRDYVATGRTEICMQQMSWETFGYHPRSKVCKDCRQKEECETKLQASVNFDIGALRRGEITSEQAYRTALAQGQGYGN